MTCKTRLEVDSPKMADGTQSQDWKEVGRRRRSQREPSWDLKLGVKESLRSGVHPIGSFVVLGRRERKSKPMCHNQLGGNAAGPHAEFRDEVSMLDGEIVGLGFRQIRVEAHPR